MTTAPRDTTHGGTVQEVLLLHPDSLDAHRCRIVVSRRGLLLRRLPDQPSRTRREGRALRVPWWTVRGFSADDTERAPDGTLVQVVEVVTDAGTLSLLAPAPEVSVLLSRVARWSGRWNRSRRPSVAAAARAMAIVASVLRPAGAPFRRAAAASSTAGWTVALWTAAALRVLAAPGLVLLRPVARLVARATVPLRRRLAATVVGLAVAAAWRRGYALGARRLGGHGRSGRLVRPVLAGALSLVLVGGAVFVATGGGLPTSGVARAAAAPSAGGAGGIDTSGMARILEALQRQKKPLDLPKASAPPAPAPPSLAAEPPLSPHEVFGFAPYWTLTQSTGFDVGGMTTIAYFSIGVNPDGSLDESGSGWDGYESQDLANLVTRAHAAGVRVVLTVNCFDQAALNQLTSSPTAPTTLSAALVQAIEAKNLDGVNIDFEGEGSADQAGLTNLVTKVSAAVHAANPHYQVTMDTYASSAGDPGGFYDIPALAPAVDAFFVMAYQLNLQGTPTAGSPLTSSMFSDLTTAQQYTAAVPADKVIMGVPYYGYTWPTTNGTMAAQATGGATPVTYAQVTAGGYPVYWDPVTDTAWTSYQVGGQWYEDYFEDPSSLYLVAQMSQSFGLGGVGIWALGMDGNDPQMLAALDGFAPATKGTLAGPTATSPSASGSTTTTAAGNTSTTTTLPAATATSPTGTPAGPGSTTTTTTAPPGSGSTTTTAPPTTTTTTEPPAGGSGSTSLRYSGTWQGQEVTLTLLTTPVLPTTGTPVYLGQLTSFATNDPRDTCLEAKGQVLDVWELGTAPTRYIVRAQKTPDCVTAELSFPVPKPATTGSSGSSSDATPASPPAPVTSPPPTTSSSSATASSSAASSSAASSGAVAGAATPTAARGAAATPTPDGTPTGTTS